MANFPPPGTDVIEHELAIDMKHNVGGASVQERLLFHGRMIIERGAPYTNAQGKRQIDFHAISWVASAFSRTTQRDIQFILSDDVTQPTSTILAEQAGTDYPASIFFHIIFDVRVNNELVYRHHHGLPAGHKFREIPPSGNRKKSPTIRKFETKKLEFTLRRGRARGAKPFKFRFVPRDCNDRYSRTLVREGKALKLSPRPGA